MLSKGSGLGALLATSLVLACSGNEPAPRPPAPPPAHPSSTPTLTAAAAPGAKPAVTEVDSPPGFTTHEQKGLPAPAAGAAGEDLPPGGTCRIGSARLTPSREFTPLLFLTEDRLFTEGFSGFTAVDAKTGSKIEDFKLGWTSSGISPSGTCVAVRTQATEISYFRLPSREKMAVRSYGEKELENLLPADDCVTGMHREGYSSACVGLLTSELDLQGTLCAGKRLGDAAMSGDGKRIALVPSQMDDRTYAGDGVHVFDTASREEIRFLERKSDRLGKVAISRDGSIVAFVDGGEIRSVGLGAGGVASSFALPPKAHVRGLVLSPAGKRLAVSFEEPSPTTAAGVAVVDVATGRALFLHRNLPRVGEMAFSPDGGRVAYTVKSGIRIVNTFTGEDTVAPGRLFEVLGAALFARGDRAAVSSPGHLTVWDTRDCSKVTDLPIDAPLDDLLVPESGSLALGFQSDTLVRIDLKTGARTTLSLQPIRTRDTQVMTPDGKQVVLGIEDEKHRMQVVQIDVATLKEIRRVTLPKIGPIGALLFSPGGKSVYAVAPGGLANGDSPTGDTSVIEVDLARGGIGRRFQLRGAAQSYNGVVLQKGRILVVNDEWIDVKTGRVLPEATSGEAPRRTLMALSADQRTALWADQKGSVLWPADDPLPASPPILVYSPGLPVVAEQAILRWDGQSCVVARAAAAGGRSPDAARAAAGGKGP